MKKFIRKIGRVSTHSYSLTIPKEIVEELKWRTKQKLEIIFDEKRKRFVVRDWKK